MKWLIQAPCKINLGLHVLRRREDGFRDIDTVFVRLPWSDLIHWEPADERSMTCSDPALPTDDRNLCVAAARRLSEATGHPHGWRMHLDKRVPYGAGLGSGSSDAAAVLRGFSSVRDDGPGAAELHRIAAELGSDVPFFLGPPVARGTGRGERLHPLDWTCPFHVVVAVPPVHVPTGPAYDLVVPVETGRPDLEAVLRSDDLDRWRRDLRNDFQEPVSRTWPEIGQTLDMLQAEGAGYTALSGSGSAVFGMFESREEAFAAASSLQEANCRTWAGRTGDPR